MSETLQTLPTREQELALHDRLVAGDPTAPPDIAVAYLVPLILSLSAKNPTLPDDLCQEAAEKAIVDLIKKPLSYNRNRRKRLFGYLKMSAQGDLQTLWQKEKRHRENRESVELSLLDGNYVRGQTDPSVVMQLREEAEIARAEILPVVKKGLPEAELRVLELHLAGEKKTAVLAEAYGISDLPEEEQRGQIYRLMDKLKKRIDRAREGHGKPS